MTHASPVPTHAHMPMPAHTTRLCMHTHAHAHHQLTHAHTPCTPATHAHRPCTCGPCHPHPCTSTAHVQAPMRTRTANSCPLPTGHTTHMWPTPPSSAHMHCPHIHALSKHSPMPTAYAEVTPPACSPHHPHAHTPNAHHACLPPIANSCMHTHQSLTRTCPSPTRRSHCPCVAHTTLMRAQPHLHKHQLPHLGYRSRVAHTPTAPTAPMQYLLHLLPLLPLMCRLPPWMPARPR